MRALHLTTAFFLMWSLFPGCSLVDPVDDMALFQTPPIQTDQQVYAVVLDTTLNVDALVLSIPVSYTNPTHKTVYFVKCGYQQPAPVLQKYEGGEWTNALGEVCPLVLTPPVEVTPGETYTQTVLMWSSLRSNSYPQFAVEEIPGTYRLVYRIYETWTPERDEPDLGKLFPLEARISNEFQITED